MRLFDAALAGLKILDAKAHTAVLADMMQWAHTNPSEVERMLNTHHFVKQSALEELNDRFFDIDETASVKQLAANWLKTHPNLRIVPEPEFMAMNKAHLSGASSGLA